MDFIDHVSTDSLVIWEHWVPEFQKNDNEKETFFSFFYFDVNSDLPNICKDSTKNSPKLFTQIRQMSTT